MLQREPCLAWLILRKLPKLHLFPKCRLWWQQSIDKKALQAHECALLRVFFYKACRRGIYNRDTNAFRRKPDGLQGAGHWKQKPSAVAPEAEQEQPQPEMQSPHEQLASSGSSGVPGLCVGGHSARKRWGFRPHWGISLPPPAHTSCLSLPAGLLLWNVPPGKCSSPSAIWQLVMQEKPLPADHRHAE